MTSIPKIKYIKKKSKSNINFNECPIRVISTLEINGLQIQKVGYCPTKVYVLELNYLIKTIQAI